MPMKRRILLPTLLAALALLAACTRSSDIGKIVGADRDPHGCLPSAGYIWSTALHDCVRVWEVGERFDDGAKPIFLVFSRDSAFAEIFTVEDDPILCRREKGTDLWRPKKGKERVSLKNGVVTIYAQNHYYSKAK